MSVDFVARTVEALSVKIRKGDGEDSNSKISRLYVCVCVCETFVSKIWRFILVRKKKKKVKTNSDVIEKLIC